MMDLLRTRAREGKAVVKYDWCNCGPNDLAESRARVDLLVADALDIDEDELDYDEEDE